MGTLQQKCNRKIISKIVGGALLINSIWLDHEDHFISFDTVQKRISLTKKYESGKLSLQQINNAW